MKNRMETISSPTARDRFERLVSFDNVLTQDGFQLANEAEYAEVLQSIEDHKYLTNENIPFEITMEQALFSWCENVYHPVMQTIDEAGLVYAFPEATRAELFMWVTRHWHFLKQDQPAVSIETAVHSYGRQFGSGLFTRLLNRIKAIAA